jgi:hypothetical protein
VRCKEDQQHRKVLRLDGAGRRCETTLATSHGCPAAWRLTRNKSSTTGPLPTRSLVSDTPYLSSSWRCSKSDEAVRQTRPDGWRGVPVARVEQIVRVRVRDNRHRRGLGGGRLKFSKDTEPPWAIGRHFGQEFERIVRTHLSRRQVRKSTDASRGAPCDSAGITKLRYPNQTRDAPKDARRCLPDHG